MRWSRGDGTGFEVRSGPDYLRKGCKVASAEAFYECVGVDVVRSSCIVSNVLGRLVQAPNSAKTSWRPGCPLPRILCIVTMLPYECSWSAREPSQDVNIGDAGCSVVSLFAVKEETLQALAAPKQPNALRLLVDYVKQAGREKQDGTPASGRTSSGVLKCIATGENLDNLGISSIMMPMVRRYNGTPVLITRSGSTHVGPANEWLEVNIDVRVWSYAARSALYNLRDSLPLASVHVGFCIQGCQDDELPECIVGACRIHNLNVFETPTPIDDPRGIPPQAAAPTVAVPAEAPPT